MLDLEEPYNPLDRMQLGLSIERALLLRPLQPLPPTRRFCGAGVYAIYYTGPLQIYAPIAPPRRPIGQVPIYVGKASPSGSAKGGVADSLTGTSRQAALHKRLQDHARSISSVEGHSLHQLRREDFACRYLVTDEVWVTLGEAVLIMRYRPVWNAVLGGFGNHGLGGGREDQRRSRWDELHPGRLGAARKLPSLLNVSELEAAVAAHFERAPEPNFGAAPKIDDALDGGTGDAEGDQPDT